MNEVIQSLLLQWQRLSAKDADECLAKMREYGSHDLLVMGESLVGELPEVRRLPLAEQDRLKRETAIAFYALGKAARLMAAYKRGEFGSEDSWKDLVTYGMMARTGRNRFDDNQTMIQFEFQSAESLPDSDEFDPRIPWTQYYHKRGIVTDSARYRWTEDAFHAGWNAALAKVGSEARDD